MRCNVILVGIRTTNSFFSWPYLLPKLFLVSCCAGNILDSDGVCLQTLDGDEAEGHHQSLLHSVPSEYVEVEVLLHILHDCCVYWKKKRAAELWVPQHAALWESSAQHVGGGPEGNVVSGLWVVYEISKTWEKPNIQWAKNIPVVISHSQIWTHSSLDVSGWIKHVGELFASVFICLAVQLVIISTSTNSLTQH